MQTFHLIQYLFVTTCTYSSLSNNLLVNSLSTCNDYLILSLTVVLYVCVWEGYSSLSNNLLVNSLSTCNDYLILSLTVVLYVCVWEGSTFIVRCVVLLCFCVCVCVCVCVSTCKFHCWVH